MTVGKMEGQGISARPYCTVRPYSTAILGFLGTAVRVRVRPKIIAVRRTILSLQFLMIFSVLQTGSLGFWVTFFNLSTEYKTQNCRSSSYLLSSYMLWAG